MEQAKNLKTWKIMRWSRQSYDWVMGWAHHKHGTLALCVLSALESIIIPLPVDPFLLAMGAGRPKRAIYYGVLASIFSVIGGLGGYVIGLYGWEATQGFFFLYVFPEDKFALVLEKFQNNAFFAIFLASFTPIPYKVFTISAGVAHISLIPFITASILGRGMRFIFIGAALYYFGPQIRDSIEKHFEKLTVALGIVLVLGLVAYRVAF